MGAGDIAPFCVPMPTPNENETQAEFVSRCIPIVLDDGTATDADQAAAVCYSLWRDSEKGGMMSHEYKTFPVTNTEINDEAQGIVTHTVAVMGNIDMGGDIIHPGAFTKTLVERGNKIRVIDQHKTDSILRVIGKPLELAEVRHDMLPPEVLLKFPEVQGALRVKTQFLMNTPEGRGAFERIKAGAIDEYSIGYEPIVQDFSTVTAPDGKVRNVRNLREVRLLEYSPVIWGMNPATSTLDVKEGEGGEDEKAVWTAAYIDDLPDASFLYIEPGKDKDEDGKTTPRSARHFPYRDADGALDLPHLRNAIARIPQSNAPGLDDAKKNSLQERARRMLDEAQKSTPEGKAGRRMRRDKTEIVRSIRELIDQLAAWAEYEDEEPDEEEPTEDMACGTRKPKKENSAPADNAGRVDSGETKNEAGPDASKATPPTCERERLMLLTQIAEMEV